MGEKHPEKDSIPGSQALNLWDQGATRWIIGLAHQILGPEFDSPAPM